MKLSLWHCEVLYILTRLSIEDVVRVSEVEDRLIEESARRGNWVWKRNKYKNLNINQQYDLGVIELLIGDFRNHDSHFNFVNLVLEKRREKYREIGSSEGDEENSIEVLPTKELIREQYIAQLGEFGMDASLASDFINRIENELMGAESESEAIVDGVVKKVVSENNITLKDKLDTVNAGYKFLMEGHDDNAVHLHNDLRKRIDFFADMLDRLQQKMPNDISFEDLAKALRPISYGATSYMNFVKLQFEIGGLKDYIKNEAVKAKMFGKGYIVVARDEMGRITQDDN